MQPPLPVLTPAERMVASRLLGLLEPHFNPSVWTLYQKTFGGRAERPSDGLPDEHLKYRKLFSLQFDDEYVAAKRHIVERASGRGITLASYPRFFLEDFANFSTVIAKQWKRRWGPVGDAMRVFNMLMLTDMAFSLSCFDEAVESDMSERLSAIETSFRSGLAEQIAEIESGVSGIGEISTRLSRQAEATLSAVAGTQRRPEQVSASVAEIVSATREFQAFSDRIHGESLASSRATAVANEGCGGIALNVAALQRATDRIGTLVELISSLAAQTNLLALNATIEAVRAGDAGRGFAVVAVEVKSLASATNSATETIRQGVAEVVTAGRAIDEALRELGRTMQTMQDSAAIVAESVAEQAGRIDAIVERADASSAGVDAIAHHAALVEGLAGEAAGLARQSDERVRAVSDRSKALEGAIGSFLEELGRARSERYGIGAGQQG